MIVYLGIIAASSAGPLLLVLVGNNGVGIGENGWVGGMLVSNNNN